MKLLSLVIKRVKKWVLDEVNRGRCGDGKWHMVLKVYKRLTILSNKATPKKCKEEMPLKLGERVMGELKLEKRQRMGVKGEWIFFMWKLKFSRGVMLKLSVYVLQIKYVEY